MVPHVTQGTWARRFEFPDPAADTREPAVTLGLPLLLEVTRCPDRKVHTLVEVVTGLPVATTNLVGDVLGQESAHLLPERLIVVVELNLCEIHCVVSLYAD